MSFQRVASRAELWVGEMKGVVIDGVPVLLVALEDGVHAYEDRCAHKGVTLSAGRLVGRRLTCSVHGWEYDVSAGCGVNPRRACLRAFPVAVEGDDIRVDVGDAAARAPAARVLDRGAYLRVMCPGRCIVTRAAIEAETGGAFRLPRDLELVMSSFKGRFAVSEDEARWELAS